MKEEWKQKEGFSKYLISNYGRVLSLDYKHKGIAEELKQNYGYSSSGKRYCRVALYNDNGKKQYLLVHRLVAELFIPNPNNLPQVNHIGEDKTNNRVDNLEWISQKDNVLYSVDRMKHRKSKSKTNTGERYITKRYKKYRVQIDYKDLGLFETLEEAKAKRDQYLKENPQ